MIRRSQCHVSSLNSRKIERALHSWCNERRHVLMLPNHYFGWESDFVSVTKKHLVIVFEIKISLADFKADFKKERHQFHTDGKNLPSQFFYVVPEELEMAVQHLVPEYAGLMIVPSDGFFNNRLIISKAAPKHHDNKLTFEQLMKMSKSLMHRFYNERDKNMLPKLV